MSDEKAREVIAKVQTGELVSTFNGEPIPIHFALTVTLGTVTADAILSALAAAGLVCVQTELLKQAEACALVASIDAPLKHQQDAFTALAAKFATAATPGAQP